MQITLKRIETTADSIKTFWFEVDRKIRYTAGQFVEITIPHDNPDKRGKKRWFTLSSSPTEELVSITTKFAPENGSSFKQALLELKPGDAIQMSEAMGDFVLPKDTARSLIFVAGGIGVTPMRSMIKYLTDTNEHRDITLLYSIKDSRQIAFSSLFNDAQLHYTPVVSGEDAVWSGEKGVLTAEAIVAIADGKPGSFIYLSGPEPMIENLVKDLKKQGVDKKRLVTDFFPGYTEA